MNIFGVLRLSNERYHNRILAWLLNPKESHNLGSQFLAGFLGLVNIDHSPQTFHRLEDEYPVFSPDTTKRRILDIYVQTDGYHIFIENKVLSTSIIEIELTDQANYIRASYPSAKHILIVPLRKEVPRSIEVPNTHNNILILEWSKLIEILNKTLEAKQDIAEDTKIFLKQYTDYAKQHILKRPPPRDYSLSLEQQIREYIGAEVESISTAILERFSQTSEQDDWKRDIKTKSSPESTNWIIQLSPPKYPEVMFEINIKFHPHHGIAKRLLFTSIGLTLNSKQVVSRFANNVHQHFAKFKNSKDERYETKRSWNQNEINKDRYEYFEEIYGYSLDRLDGWQKKEDEVVERAVEWIREFLPIFKGENSSKFEY